MRVLKLGDQIHSTLSMAQSGLMYMPPHGLFVVVRLTDKARDPVTQAVQAVERAARDLTASGTKSGAVAAFNPDLWSEWLGSVPEGDPGKDTILNRSSHLRNSFGDAHVFLFLKSASETGCQTMESAFVDALDGMIADAQSTVARHRKDGRVLDHHFSDGITSPMDPVGVNGPILQDGGAGQGGCWLFTQDFRVDWDGYAPLSLDAKENVIGRGVNGSIIPDDDQEAHIRRARVFDADQANIKLLRQAMPYGRSPDGPGREAGIYFIAFCSDTSATETVLASMVGHGDGAAPDRLLNHVTARAGGYWYVPPRAALGLEHGLTAEDFQTAPFWKMRSENGLMFYNGNDYLNAMSTGDYDPGDPPSERVLALAASAFSRWRDNWYVLRDIPRISHLKEYLGLDEQEVLNGSVTLRKGVAIKKTLTQVHSTSNVSYPMDPDFYGSRAETFRIHPQDILFGVMPELSLARGKEVMPYLHDGNERISSLTMGIDEGGMVGHVVPDHFAVLDRGLGTYLSEVTTLRDSAETPEKREFYQSVLHALEGVQGWCLNYAALADAMIGSGKFDDTEVQNLQVLAERARRLSTEKPVGFADAVQCVFMMHCCLHLIGNPIAVGRLDQYLGGFLDADDISDEAAQELIDAFWVKLDEKAIHNRHFITDHLGYGSTAVPYSGGNFPQGSAINQWIQQVTVGGVTRDGQPAFNRVTMLCLKAARRLPFNAPCLSLRVTKDTPDEVVDEAAQALLSGGAHPILFQDERLVDGLHRFSGFPIEDARDYACDGCYEPMINGRTEFTFGSVAPLDALEMAINQGATIMGSGIIHLRGLKQGQRTVPPDRIESFDQIKELMSQHMYWLVTRLFNGILSNYGNIGKVSPCPLLSSMMDGCIDSGTDMYSGGARYHLIAPMFVGLSVTIDSLYAIKKLVYDRDTAVTTLPELLDCLRSDWGHDFTEPFQSTLDGESRTAAKARTYQAWRRLALDLPKFGTGDAEIDEIAAWLCDMVSMTAKQVMDQPPKPFDATLETIRKTYGVEFHMAPGVGTFEEYVGAGSNSAASADGRRFAQPYPSDFSPTPVPQDLPPIPQAEDALQPRRDSYRSIYRAMASWDRPEIWHNFSNATPVDMNVREDFPKEDLKEFIRRYGRGDGVGANLVTVTCADPDTYAAAETEPERYELVRVRMGGWTEFFAAMFPAHQEQHMRRPFFTPETPGAAQ